jgi:hypothetical protein
MNHLSAAIPLVAILLSSCYKPRLTETASEPVPVNTPLQSGFPENKREINGYLYASCSVNTVQGGSESANVNMYGTFSDPAANLISGYNHYYDGLVFSSLGSVQGNVNVGSVFFNGSVLHASFSSATNIIYMSNNPNFFPLFEYKAQWRWLGNKSFKETDIQITRGFPRITPATAPSSITVANGLRIELGGLVSNYDSATVMLNLGSSFNYSLKKSVAYPVDTVVFSKAELQAYLSGYSMCNFSVYAYNYSNQTVYSKVYVYELANKYSKYITIYH